MSTAIPEGVTGEEATMCEPFAAAVHSVRSSNIRLGDLVAVLSVDAKSVCRRHS